MAADAQRALASREQPTYVNQPVGLVEAKPAQISLSLRLYALLHYQHQWNQLPSSSATGPTLRACCQ